MRLSLLLIMLLLISKSSFSQEVVVKSETDTNVIMIGQQLNMSFEIEQPKGVTVHWPSVPDTFSFMEVLQRFPVDTISINNEGNITLRQNYILTSFDSGYHVIPPFVFTYTHTGDTAILNAESNPLLVTVNTIPIDVEKAIKDIKDLERMPFTWQDALPYLLGVLLLVLLIYLVRLFLKNRKKKPAEPVKNIPRRPAHEIALEELKKLNESKLWQNGNYKGYHTALSDITRTFIENRWGVNAMEMTTDEILKLKIITEQPDAVLVELKYLLELSDLVKFAKMIPVSIENEQGMQNALNFVSANKVSETKKEVEV